VIAIAGRISDTERVERYKALNLNAEQTKDLLEYDKAVERNEPTKYDLTGEQIKVARKYTHTGTRKTNPKAPTVYKLAQRQRRPNATQTEMLTEVMSFLQSGSQYDIQNVQLAPKGYVITYQIGDDNYKLTISKNRTK
jgi:hypothetical protein